MINPWTIGISLVATGIILFRHLAIALGPQFQFYALTALQLIGVLMLLVLLFMGVSSLTISVLGRLFRKRLQQSYVLFLGWNMLRSQRLITPLMSRIRSAIAQNTAAGKSPGASILVLLLMAALLLSSPFIIQDIPGWVPGWALEWCMVHCILGGLLLALKALGGLLAIRSRTTSDEKSTSVQLKNSITLPNFISMVGIGIGVWALIVVMGVMSGFEGDLRSKILNTNPHILVSPGTYDGAIDMTDQQIGRINEMDNVSSSDVFLEDEAMISSPYNSSVQLTVRGIEPSGTTGQRLRDNIIDGSITLMSRPHLQGSDTSWVFTKMRKPGALGPAIPEAQKDEDEDSIQMPPMPGGQPIGSKNTSVIPVVIADEFARKLGAGVNSQLKLEQGTSLGTLTLKVSAIFRKDPLLAYQPDFLISDAHTTKINPVVLKMSWPVKHGDKTDTGRLAWLRKDTPLEKNIAGNLMVGVLPEAAQKQKDEPATGSIVTMERTYPGIVLGVELASSLRVQVGDEIQLISLDGEVGPMGVRPKARTFHVAAIFETGMYEFDLKLAYALREETVRFFGHTHPYNRMEIQLANPATPWETTDSIRASLGQDYDVQNWQSLNRNLFSALQLEKIAMFFVLGFIILVASFNIISSLAMLIQEKSQEIAILKSMGATDQKVMNAFISVGLFLGLIGAGCGALMGIGCCILVDRVGVPLPKEYYIPTIPVEINGIEVFAAFGAAMLICVAATVYPSRAASRLTPVEGLRYE